MKKIMSFISLIALLNLVALVGLGGFLAATGRLDKTKALAISDMLKQPGSPDKLREKLYDVMVPSTQPQAATSTAPAAQKDLRSEGATPPASAQERLDYTQKVLEEEQLRLDNQKQFLQQERDSLVHQQALLDAGKADLDNQKKALDARVAAASTTQDQTGFLKTMALFDELKPREVKDLLATMTTDDIARYLTTMDADRAAKIIAEFKTPDEKTSINAVLDKIRGTTRPAGTGAALGTPAEALSPAAVPKTGP
jgi:flagellar motility protein MotE (MotC chaperone)